MAQKMAQKRTATPSASAPKAAGGAASTVVETVEETVGETIEAAGQAGSEAAKGYETALWATRRQAERTSGALFQGYDDLAAVGKDNMEACLKCGGILAKGMEGLSKELMKYAQVSFEANLAVTKKLMGVKTVREAIDLQADHARHSLDHMVGEAAKLTEMSVDLTNQVLDPIQSRINATAQNLFKPIGA